MADGGLLAVTSRVAFSLTFARSPKTGRHFLRRLSELAKSVGKATRQATSSYTFCSNLPSFRAESQGKLIPSTGQPVGYPLKFQRAFLAFQNVRLVAVAVQAGSLADGFQQATNRCY
jgi:hypothetical protein